MNSYYPLRIRSDFPSGNGKNFCEITPDRWTMELEGDFIYGPWYYIELQETVSKKREIELKILGIPSIPDLLTQADHPIVKINKGEWQRLPSKNVSIEYTDDTKFFETPVIVFLEEGGEIPKDKKTCYPLSNICLKLHIPANSTVYLATVYPYTYARLLNWLDTLSNLNESLREYLKIKSIGKSEEGRDISLIILTNFEKKEKGKQKLLITARMHPALEVSGSWGIEEIVWFLLGSSERSQEILNQSVISIIPMVNVDGVYKGNPHYNAKGVDVCLDFKNRKSKEAQAVFNFMNTFKPDFCIDLHGWLSHDKGKFPFDGAYVDTTSVKSFDKERYIQLIKYLKKKVDGFGSYALYRFAPPGNPVRIIYEELNTLGCTIEVNPGSCSLELVKKRSLSYFLAIYEFVLSHSPIKIL